jgi:glycosyltransferase involved in cell wall biosynthesis
MTPRLSVVIPAFNEETNIRIGALDRVARYLEEQSYTWEVLLVDDGSRDGTGKLLDEHVKKNRGFRVLHNPHQGKAATVVSGVSEARGDIILFCDLDQATPIREIEKLLPWFSKGSDIVIGSRRGKREGAPLLRLVMARSFMILRSVFLGLKGISDTQCGFKAFRRDVARDVFGKLKLYGTAHTVNGSSVTAGFDIEVLFVARVLGYKIAEVPVEWHYVETRRVNPLIDSWNGLMDIVAIRVNQWKGDYKR